VRSRRVVSVEEKGLLPRRRKGVGGELGLRRGSAAAQDGVVDDEECAGTRGVARGGVNRRRLLRQVPAIDGAIGELR
jgi:hypothetical protein